METIPNELLAWPRQDHLEAASPHDGMPPAISVVIPVYNSAATLPELCRRLKAGLTELGLSYELVFVDDGSRDKSYEVLEAHARRDPAIRVIKLVRNFGQHPAITAGLRQARGRWIVLMDDDLQTPPEEIGKLYAKAQQGYDIVCGARVQREGSVGRRFGSRLANFLMKGLFGDQNQDTVSSFRLVSRRVVDSYLELPETHTYVAALMSWMGYPQASVPVRHEASRVGRSRYGYFKLLALWFSMAVGFSDRPLRLASWTGFLLSAVAGFLGVRVLIQYFVSGIPVAGYSSLFVSQMFLFGITLLFLGIFGEYLSRIYREVRRRPYFILDHEKSIRAAGMNHGQDFHHERCG